MQNYNYAMMIPLLWLVYSFLAISMTNGGTVDTGSALDGRTRAMRFAWIVAEKVLALNETSQKCREDVTTYLTAFVSGNYSANPWALEMIDSSSKGLQSGGLTNEWLEVTGDYEECISAEHPTQGFTGQYCSLNVVPKTDNVLNAVSFLGVCLPSTCSEKELQKAYGRLDLEESLQLPWHTYVRDGVCFTREPIKTMYGWRYIIAVFLLSVLMGTVTVSTLWHLIIIKKGKGEHMPQVLGMLSAAKGVQEFFKPESSPQDIKVIHGLRVFALMGVLFGHRRMLSATGSFLNAKYVFRVHLTYDNLPICLVETVDIFFVISWILFTFQIAKDISTGITGKEISRKIVWRMVKFQILLAFHLFVTVPINVTLLDGAHKVKIIPFLEVCQGAEWKHLTFTHTIFTSNSKCQENLWQFSSEMQLTVLIPFLVLVFLKFPKLGGTTMALGSLASLVYYWSCAYTYDYTSEVLPAGIVQRLHFERAYNRFHTFTTAFVFGFKLYKDFYVSKKTGLQKKSIYIGWTAWVLTWILLLITTAAHLTVDGSTEISKSYSASISIFKKFATPIVFSWLIYASVHGNGGVFEKLFLWRGCQYVGKLSIGIVLYHASIQLFKFTKFAAPYNVSWGFKIRKMYSDWVLSLAAAFLFHILIEGPLTRIVLHFFNKAWPRQARKRPTE